MRRIDYTDLDTMYRPGFVHVNGYGENGGGRMMGGILASLFGKPQAWYSNVSQIQKELTILRSEVSSFEGVWDTIAAQPAAKSGGFTPYAYTMEWALNHLKAILVTSSREPSDAEISSANTYAKRVRTMVELARKVAPELAAQAAAERARVEEGLRGTGLVSPAEAGEEAFLKSLDEQASKLGGGMGMVGIGLAALAVMMFFGRK
jgi:hypothetical protein